MNTDKKFLAFFFKRLRTNDTGRYEDDFPFISPCGREMNYIHCDDLPIVFTHLLDQNGEIIQDIATHAQKSPSNIKKPSELLSYGGTGNLLTIPFQPGTLCMLPDSGRIYHTAPAQGGNVGLVKSSLALALSSFFQYEEGKNPETDPPVRLTWQGQLYNLDNSVLSHLQSQE